VRAQHPAEASDKAHGKAERAPGIKGARAQKGKDLDHTRDGHLALARLAPGSSPDARAVAARPCRWPIPRDGSGSEQERRKERLRRAFPGVDVDAMALDLDDAERARAALQGILEKLAPSPPAPERRRSRALGRAGC
jgi:hypothetical protein